MGGFGSGRYKRTTGKRKCENSLSLDIREIKRSGRLSPGQGFLWQWSTGGNVHASIEGEVLEGCLILKYIRNRTDAVEQKVSFTWTPCNYGGERAWFLCPHCGRRVAILYSGGKYFACRGCTGIVYRSTGKTAIDRKLSRAKRLRLKIGGIPGPANDLPRSKPKFMHRETWLQIKNEIYALELPFWLRTSRLNDMMDIKLDKIAKRMGCEISWRDTKRPWIK